MRALFLAMLVWSLAGICPVASPRAAVAQDVDTATAPDGDTEDSTTLSADVDPDPAAEAARAEVAADASVDAAANEAALAPDRSSRRVAVLLLAASGVEAALADDFTEVAIGAIAARGGVTIVGKEEFQARLGQGEARSLDCVTSAACVGRVGVQLEVDEVISGTLNRRGDSWTFELNRVDVRTGELLGRAYREVEGDLGVVAGALSMAVPELYVEHHPESALHVTSETLRGQVSLDGQDVGELTPEGLRLTGLAPGAHELSITDASGQVITRSVLLEGDATLQLQFDRPVSAPMPRTRVSSLVWVGAGLTLVGAAVALGFGVAAGREPTEGGTRRAAISFLNDRERDARVANIGWVGAGVGLGTAVLGFLLSDFGSRSTSIGAALSPRGGFALSVQGTLSLGDEL